MIAARISFWKYLLSNGYYPQSIFFNVIHLQGLVKIHGKHLHIRNEVLFFVVVVSLLLPFPPPICSFSSFAMCNGMPEDRGSNPESYLKACKPIGLLQYR